MMIIFALFGATGIGIGIFLGVQGTWWWMNRQFKKKPYTFRILINDIIAKREAKEKEML